MVDNAEEGWIGMLWILLYRPADIRFCSSALPLPSSSWPTNKSSHEYSFRLLGPGTFLIFVSIISYLRDYLNKQSFRDFKIIIIILTIVSFLLYVPIKTYARYDQTYSKTLMQLNERYDAIPSGSILAFETNKHLKYYRSDLIIKKPIAGETIYDFYKRVNKSNSRRVFLEISDSKRINLHHESFKERFAKEDAGSIVEISN